MDQIQQPDGWLYDENGNRNPPVHLKVVGVDSYNEDTDYRLYTKPCEAYTYLFDKAASSTIEYGAYMTKKGIIVLPNSQSIAGPDGKRRIKFRRWRLNPLSNNLVVYTDKGIIPVQGLVHTHPSPPGTAEPSLPEDTDLARDNPGVKHYVMNYLVMNQFFSDGSTQPYLGVMASRCP